MKKRYALRSHGNTGNANAAKKIKATSSLNIRITPEIEEAISRHAGRNGIANKSRWIIGLIVKSLDKDIRESLPDVSYANTQGTASRLDNES